ncbi:MAG: ABC transporter ATP-binding protein/permease [Clostridiaceae bacterium]|nr:ABC transporter ATP-binding protein/permease [Clostridiaceae bacterium]
MKKYSAWSNWKYVFCRMCAYDKRYPLYIAVKSAAAFLSPFISAIIPSVAIGLTAAGSSLETFALVMAGLVLGSLCIGLLSVYMDNLIQTKNYYVSYDSVQHEVIGQILHMDYAILESAKGKMLADSAKYSYELDWQGWNRMMDMFTPFAYNLLGVLIYSVILIPKCPWVLPVFVLMTVSNLLIERKISRRAWGKHRKIFHETDSKVNYFFERSTSATDGKDIRMYQMETWFGHIMQEMIEKRLKYWKKAEVGYFWPCFSDTVWSLIRDIIAYSVLVAQYMQGGLDAASFTLYLGIIAGFAGWLNGGNMGDGFIRAYSEMLRCNWNIEDYREFMQFHNAARDDKKSTKGRCFSSDSSGVSIEFRNVCFRYPEAEQDTIHDLNLHICAGEKIALVGVNGAGKTTLIKLLCGFYKPTSGKILVDGVDITEYDLEDYQRGISAVFQDMMIMASSVAENVACIEKEQIDTEKLWKCLTLADIADKVRGLPKKEQTSVTNFLDKDGVMFSGGELQRILLARAIYKEAPVLLLDEPTSALDPLAETAIYEKYHQLSQGKTTVFISHRLASTRFCDRIIFYEHGQVIEEGTHQELMERGGEYAQMFLLQSQYYDKEGEAS